MKFLVTGGAGFIGSNFVHTVLAGKLGSVWVLDKLTYAGHRSNLSAWEQDDRFKFVEGDIGDRELVRSLLAEYQPEAIVNFAAESHVDRSIDGADVFILTNINGTFALLDEALKYWQDRGRPSGFRFHHISTDEVYGSLRSSGSFSEATPFAPNSPYAASKASSDHLVRAYHVTHGLPTSITNCSNNYGPYQLPEKLIPLALLNALEGKPVPVYGDGQNIRDWLYVEDHCAAILEVISRGKPGETYNVGGDCERTNLDLLHALFEALKDAKDIVREQTDFDTGIDYHSLITFVADRPGHDRRYAVDSSKIRNDLGWTPQLALEAGLRSTVEWYLANLDWCREVKADSSSGRRLGLREGVTS